MSNRLDSVKNINNELDSTAKRLEEINNQLILVSKSARDMESIFGKVKTPKGLSDELVKEKENITLLNALIKEREATERKLTSTIAKKVLIQDDATKKLAKENEELKILRREQRNQVKAVSELAGSYTKLSAQTNILIKRYQDLAVRQAKGEQLTAKETRRLEKLGAAIEKNQNILKKTDAEVGRFQRNVGNYAGSFDGLSFSIAQIAREAPAAAVSLNTFILGISNNIPMLQDELTKLINKNKELVSQGKPTINIFKRLASSLVSPQVLLAALVTTFTLYNKQIIQFISNTLKGRNALRGLSDEQKIYNKALEEGAKNAASEVAQSKLLFTLASDITKTQKQRNKAVDQLIKSSRGLITEQDRLNILNGEAVEIENKLTQAILNKAIVRELEKKISEDLAKLLDNNLKIQENSAKANEALNTQERERINLIEAQNFVEQERQKIINNGKLSESEKIERVNKLFMSLRQAEAAYRKASAGQTNANELDRESNKLKKENANINENINNIIDRTRKLLNINTEETDKNTKAINRRSEALTIQQRILESINKISSDIKPLSFDELQEKIKNGEELELPDFKKVDPKTAEEIIKVFSDLFKDDESFKLPEIDTEAAQASLDKFTKKVSDDLIKAFDKELLQESLSDLAGTIEQFTGVSGKSFLNFFEKVSKKGVKSFEDIADIAKASFDTIGELSNAFFNARIEGYEQDILANDEYYENLLDNENLSDEERKRLEDSREAREKDIRDKQRREQRKQAEIDKALSVASIIANTAKAVVAALPNVPLSVAVGAIGAAQLGIALATPIPQFKDGHLSGTHEGLAIVNDAYGSNYQEIIERKDGTLEMYSGRNQLIHMNKGDKVHKAGTHGAEDYLKGISDNDLIKDVNKHAMLATLQHQNYLIHKLDNKKVIDSNKLNADRIIKAIKGQKTRFNLNQNIDLGRDINFANRLNNTL